MLIEREDFCVANTVWESMCYYIYIGFYLFYASLRSWKMLFFYLQINPTQVKVNLCHIQINLCQIQINLCQIQINLCQIQINIYQIQNSN